MGWVRQNTGFQFELISLYAGLFSSLSGLLAWPLLRIRCSRSHSISMISLVELAKGIW
jgi:hypothetical protein